MRLHDPGELRGFLRRHGLDAAKSLGQHFLVSEAAVRKIVAAAEGCAGVLEIGPGPGVLTRPLTEQAERVLALELDSRFVRALKESAPAAEVRQADALKAELSAILQELPTPRAIVSNMPYYITGPLLQRFAEVRRDFDRAVLMMQREVGERITAPAGDSERGSLSVFLQSQFDIRRVANVPAGAFMPPPKVESLVLAFTPKSADAGEEVYRIVRMGFAQPRKTLANNLSAGLRRNRDEIIPILEGLGLWEKTRAQELEEATWRALTDALTTLE